jgi:hypothetical protein
MCLFSIENLNLVKICTIPLWGMTIGATANYVTINLDVGPY